MGMKREKGQPYSCPWCGTVYHCQEERHTVKDCQDRERENSVKTRRAERGV